MYVVKHFQTKTSQPLFGSRLPELRFLSHVNNLSRVYYAMNTKSFFQLNIEEMVDILSGESFFMAVVDKFPRYTLHTLLEEDRLGTEKSGLVLGQIFAALGYLHDKDWTHGNLDPRSIRVVSRECLRVTLTDVALSDYVDLGKPDDYHETYASQRSNYPDKRPADIWSAGVVALQLLHPDSLPTYDDPTPYKWAQKLERLVTKWRQEHWNDTSAFVGDILKTNFRERPTAIKVLNHPWIVQNRGECPVDNPHHNPYIPLGSRDMITLPPISFIKQGISSPSNCLSHLDFTPQTRHTSSEASHHARSQSSLAPPSSTGRGNSILGPYDAGVGPSQYSSAYGLKLPTCNELVAPRATGTLSSQRPCAEEESASRKRRAGVEEDTMERRYKNDR